MIRILVFIWTTMTTIRLRSVDFRCPSSVFGSRIAGHDINLDHFIPVASSTRIIHLVRQFTQVKQVMTTIVDATQTIG